MGKAARMEGPHEPRGTKPHRNALWRRQWHSLAAVSIAAGCVATLALRGDWRLAGFVGVMLLVPLALIACPRFFGQGLPRWVDRPTPVFEVYLLGWLLLASTAASVGAYVCCHVRQ